MMANSSSIRSIHAGGAEHLSSSNSGGSSSGRPPATMTIVALLSLLEVADFTGLHRHRRRPRLPPTPTMVPFTAPSTRVESWDVH